jgi:hypothetical protein
VTSDRPGTTRGSDRATASEGTSSPRGLPDPRSSGNAARKGRASGTVSLLCESGEFGDGRSSNVVIKTGGETVSLRGFDRYVGTVTITSARSVRSPPPMTAELASADPIGL